MNRGVLCNKQIFIDNLEKGTQITTYKQEPTTWIPISDSELLENITNQEVLQVFTYHQITNQGYTRDVTVVEQSFIHETSIFSVSSQTDYLINKHRYSKEAIKPYFLNFVDSERSRKAADLEEDIESALISCNVLDDSYIRSARNSVIKIDEGIQVTPKPSQEIEYYLKNLAIRAKLKAVKNTDNPSLTEPILQKDNTVVVAVPLCSENSKHFETGKLKDDINHISIPTNSKPIEPFETKILKKDRNHISRIENSQYIEFIEIEKLQKDVNISLSSAEYSSDSSRLPETEEDNNYNLNKVILCNRKNSAEHFVELEQTLNVGRFCAQEELVPANMSFIPENVTTEGGNPSSCPPPVEISYKKEKKKDSGSKKCDDDDDGDPDDVRILCKKGDVRFKLRCKRVGGNPSCMSKLGNEVRYECEMIPQDEYIDPEILNSCDLKCSLISQPRVFIPEVEIVGQPKQPKTYDLSNETNEESCKLVNPLDNKSTSLEKKNSTTGNKSLNKKICTTENKINPTKNNNSYTENKVDSFEHKSSFLDENICNKDIKRPDCIVSLSTPASASFTEKQRRPCPTVKLFVHPPEQQISEKESIIFACRSKTKQVSSVKRNDEKGQMACPENLFSDITNAMTAAHYRTIATIKTAAEDLYCNVTSAVTRSKEQDNDNISRVVESASEILNDVKRKAQECDKRRCDTLEKFRICTKEAFKSATRKTKEALGYPPDEYEDENKTCTKPKLPPFPCPKKVNCYRTESEMELEEAVRQSVEEFYHTVCKSTQEATNAVADLVSHSMMLLGIKMNEPSRKEDETVLKSERQSADITMAERQEYGNNSLFKSSVGNTIDNIYKTKDKIAESTHETYNDLVEQGKKFFCYDDDGFEDLQKKKESIKQLLTGFTLFENHSKDEDSELNTDTAVSSASVSLKSSFETTCHSRLQEKSSNSSMYDNPTNVALVTENSTVAGVFSTLKDKIYHMFSKEKKSESDIQESASESSIREVGIIIKDKDDDSEN